MSKPYVHVRPVEEATFVDKCVAAIWSAMSASVVAFAIVLLAWNAATIPPEPPPPPPKPQTTRLPLKSAQPPKEAPRKPMSPVQKRSLGYVVAFGSFFLVLIGSYGPYLRLRLHRHAHGIVRRAAEKAAAEQAAREAATRKREKEEQVKREREQREREAAYAVAQAEFAERTRWQSVTARALHDEATDVFATYAAATPEQRLLITGAYNVLLNGAHPSLKDERRSLPPLPTLSPQARLLFLPHVIGADHDGNRYDRLDLAASQPAKGRYVYQADHGLPDLANWQKKIPAINAYLGGRWRVELGPNTSVILAGMPSLPEAFRLTPDMLRADNLFLGVNLVTGDPFYVPIRRQSHTLVQGTTGVGKSTFMHQIMASVLMNPTAFDAVYLIDLKYGLEARRYTTLSAKVHLVDKVEQVPGLLTKLEKIMSDRAADMIPRGSVLWEKGRVLVIVDECADLFKVREKRKPGDATLSIEDRFASLAQKARAMGILLWMQAHEATNEGVPLVVRRHLRTLIGFKQSNAQAMALMGQVVENTPIPFPDLKTGQVIYQDGNDGTQRYALQGAMVTFEDVKQLVTGAGGTSGQPATTPTRKATS